VRRCSSVSVEYEKIFKKDIRRHRHARKETDIGFLIMQVTNAGRDFEGNSHTQAYGY
jgi:hypothetical protein